MGRIHVVPDDATAIDDWENLNGEHEIERLADPAVSNRCDHRWAICEGVSHCCALSAGHSGDTHVCLCHAEMTDDGAVR